MTPKLSYPQQSLLENHYKEKRGILYIIYVSFLVKFLVNIKPNITLTKVILPWKDVITLSTKLKYRRLIFVKVILFIVYYVLESVDILIHTFIRIATVPDKYIKYYLKIIIGLYFDIDIGSKDILFKFLSICPINPCITLKLLDRFRSNLT